MNDLLVLFCLFWLAVSGEHHMRPPSGWYSNTNANKTILVDGQFFGDPPGGVEAIIQLSIALSHATVDKNEVAIHRLNTYHPRFVDIYGEQLIHVQKDLKDLHPGDIFITTEGVLCPTGVPAGVQVFVWLLANYLGCRDDGIRYLSHNLFLSQFKYEKKVLRLPRERILNPYLSPPLVSAAHESAGLLHDGSISYQRSEIKAAKKKLVLIDSDVPDIVFTAIKKAAEDSSGSYIHLTSLSSSEVLKAYKEGMVMVDWCMRGSERCPLESSLFGVISVTNDCETGSSFADFPIPSKFLIVANGSDERALVKVFKELFQDIFLNYWTYVPQFQPLRHTVLAHNPTSLIKESISFLATTHISDKSSSALLENGCINC